MTRFGKPADTIVHGEEPFNAEPPPAALAAAALTPLERFYVRNHGAVPAVDPAAWRLRVGGLVERRLELGLADLQRLPHAAVTATLQCAGNRRAGLLAVRDIPGEAPWGPGATATAVWRGVRLADVLAAAAVRPEAGYVAFVGLDPSPEAEPPQAFGGSVGLVKARRPEVVLAWEMNGAPLPPVHGGPVRVVVPGYIGARSVKWLDRIELRAEPWDGHFQATAYRLLAPDEAPAPGVGMPLGEVALNAEILEPAAGARVAAGRSPRAGTPSPAASARWRASTCPPTAAPPGAGPSCSRTSAAGRGGCGGRELDLGPGEHELCVRAWDSAGATQPEDPATVWNPKGYANSAWGRARISAA